ncbi:hypothetical protein [Flavobacterium sp.]|uniref:hypothetical protein n=1 Tax=Flavobacterium sp. TaxID=239 RepID=UPI0037525E24
MKKLLYFITFFVFSVSFSQEKTIPSGEYKTLKSETESVNIILLDNKRYSVSVLSGVYEQKNNSIYFKSDQDNEPVFKLEFGFDKPNSKKILLKFDGLFLNYGDDKYIGVQETASSEIIYKTAQEFSNFNAMDYNEEINYEKEIDHCYALYFVKESYYSESIIEKFILPKDVSQITVSYSRSKNSSMNLNGYYDEKTKVLSVGAGRKNILNFALKNNEEEKSKFINPSEISSVKKFTYDGKKINEDYYNQTVDSAATYVDSVEPSAPAYSFKLKIEKSVKEAFNATKNSKDKSRFLVIINDTNNKNIEQQFKDFIESYQENLGYSMYEGYDPQYDHFDFYLANAKDKAELKKFGITDNPSITYFNTDGVKLYHSKSQITDDSFSYYNTNTINTELKVLDANAKFDAVFSIKKNTFQETLNVLYEISKQEVPYNYDSEETPPTIIDIQKFVPPVVVKEQIKEVLVVEEVKSVEIVQDYAVDSTAVIDSAYDYDYSMLKIKENKYKFKTKENVVNEKWIKLLETFNKDKNVNKKLAITILKELSNKGFNKILYSKNQVINSKINQLEMDYILKHYDTISNFNNTNEEATYDGDYYITYDLKNNISSFLNQSVAKENCKSKDDLTKAMARFKTFVATSKNDSSVASSYMNALKENDFQTEYLTAYENYYTTVIKDNSNIIEQLDASFAIKQEEEYSANWVEYKYDFANQANEASWFVVEKVKDASLIKKAIVWSETSLKIQKDDRYYLDTLAQLYYKDGQKEKAIITEQKAIDVLSDDDYIQREEYKVVLEKMKNGTY